MIIITLVIRYVFVFSYNIESKAQIKSRYIYTNYENIQSISKGIKLIKAWARNSEKLQEIIRD